MTRDNWRDLIEAVGVISIVGSLVFLAVEVRTNTASNEIAILQSQSARWVDFHGQTVMSRDLAKLLVKVSSNSPLDDVEKRQYRSFVFQRISQAVGMLRLYDRGFISREEVNASFLALRNLAKSYQPAQEIVEGLSNDRLRGLIPDDDGFEVWFDRQTETYEDNL